SPLVGQMFFRATLFSSYYQFKSKMQVQIIRAQAGEPMQYRNVFHAAYVISQKHGIRGCYQGLSATWLRNIPANGCFFGFYEISRTLQTPEGGTVKDVSPYGLLLSGGVGGFFYWFLTYPTDVIKSTMQADNAAKSKRKFKGVVDCAKKLYYNEGGWTRFYKGFTPCLMRSIPANAAMFYVVETMRKYFPL
ncbi:hypothetical protein QZH41_013432, partial [Actinostola sp. cb2023]